MDGKRNDRLGGTSSFTNIFNDGGRYDPIGNAWIATTTAGAPVARFRHTAVWTGSQMIVWGGEGNSGLLNDVELYTSGQVMFLYQKP